MKKIVFPKVGFRIIKTMITVIICLLIKFIITTLWNNSLVDQLYSPFFTSVGACYSLSSNRKDTLKQAQVRSFGSILGGVFALVVLYLSLGLNSLFGFYQNGQVVNNLYTLVEYILIALLIIGLIWSCVFFKMSHITYIACLTYMSVTVGNVAGVPNYIFAANRVLSTIFGVLVALGINLANIHLYNNHHNILVVTTTGCILNRDNSLSNYQKYQLNNLAERNAPIYYATTRSSASLDEIFSKVLITNPLVIMNGAAIFDFNKKTYFNVVNIDKEAADLIENVCRMNEVDYFAHCIFNNMLTIYYERLTNPGSQAFYNLRKDHFDSFACNVKSHQDESCYYIVIDNLENIDLIERLLKESPHGSKLNILKTRNFDYPGYFMLKICSNETNKFIALSKLVAIDHNLITFGGTRSDVDLMKNSEVSFCLNSANDLVKNAATHILNSSDVNDMTKQINKCFHRKNIK